MPNMAAVESSRTIIDSSTTLWPENSSLTGRFILFSPVPSIICRLLMLPIIRGRLAIMLVTPSPYLSISRGTRCFALLVIPIAINPTPDTIVRSILDTMLCVQQSPSYTLSLVDADHYIWSTGASSQQITVNQTGPYWAYSARNCRTFIDRFHVSAL